MEKGSVALFSMLLKVINIEWFMVIHKNKNFDYAKVWNIFWIRAQRQWKETARDKEYKNSGTYTNEAARQNRHG